MMRRNICWQTLFVEMIVMQTEWETAPNELHLVASETHLWRIVIEEKSFDLHSLTQLLSEDEMSRANRFRFQKDRMQFIIARGMLRTILSRYLNVQPASLRFGYGAQGKPYLTDENGEPHNIRFNLSHSEEIILYAVMRGQELGIDVERIRPEFATDTIAEQFFSPSEVKSLRRLAPALQPEAFFNCWTRKEAFLKARAEGLTYPLDQFEVSLLPDEPPALLSLADSSQEISRWSFFHLMPKPDYIGTLVVNGHCAQLRHFTDNYS